MARSKFEIRADKLLKSQGYQIDYKARPSYPIKNYNTDYFHLFDLMAHKPGELRLISIKGKSVSKQHQDDITGFKLPKGISKELWRYDRDPKNKRRLRCRIWYFTDKGKCNTPK